ncbi:MAG: hypothetical protein ACODAQ_06370 [Phycisphaeraceae bacterium]
MDGQWQGITRASDGCTYFFAGSHRGDIGAPFFRYIPGDHETGKIKLLCNDMSRACGEDSNQVPAQGKVHSDVLEHDGWLYFGTHLSDYTPQGAAAYTGSHLMAYELATGTLRDLGIVHPNYTNYSGIGLDRSHNRIYFYTTPFHNRPDVDGPHLHRIDLATGNNEDLGLIAPWYIRSNDDPRALEECDHKHGQACEHLHVDSRGDCWFTLRHGGEQEDGLFVARAETGRIERHPEALPNGMTHWCTLTPLDEDRALILFPDGFWIFDSRRFDGTPSAFEQIKPVSALGLRWARLAVAGNRFYWAHRKDQERNQLEHPVMHLFSASFSAPDITVEHGPIRDEAGRVPRSVADIAAMPEGHLHFVGRWHVLPEEFDSVGVDRHGNIVAPFFTVLDVSADLPHTSTGAAADQATVS